MPRVKKSLDLQIRELKLKVHELESEKMVLRYLETMPEYDPVYKYCFATSNMSILGMQHDIDSWLRAVMIHMSRRRPGHGGAWTDAEIVTIPVGLSDDAIERWLAYVNQTLRAKAKRNSKIKVT